MASAVRVRAATRDDFDDIVRLQHRAYAANRAVLGVEPLPLLADYAELLSRTETWVAVVDLTIAGVLIMDIRPDDALIWSVASDPDRQSSGIGTAMMRHADAVAKERRCDSLRLYTGARLVERIAWYGRLGFTVKHEEQLADRVVVHMVKQLS
ncbi:MAG: GNAT family N-acetyltransferase [Bosea sp. (in: a-proteobacteria)]